MLASIAKMCDYGEHYNQCAKISSLASHSSLFTSARVQYPYINGELHTLWNEAFQLHSNPLEAWQSIQTDKEKRIRYTMSRGQKNYIQTTWQEVMTLMATAIIYSIYAYSPQSIVGIAPQPHASMASHAAGARFFCLLGAPCISADLDFAGWSILATASDWLDIPQNGPQLEKEATIDQLLNSAHILFSWSNATSSLFEKNINKNYYTPNLLDLYINASSHSNHTYMLSDIILPSACNDEFDDISMQEEDGNTYKCHIKKHHSIQNPAYESKETWKLFQELAENLSYIIKKNTQLQQMQNIPKQDIIDPRELWNFHADMSSKYKCLGPNVTHIHGVNDAKAMWDCAKEYEILKAQLGVMIHKSSIYGMPRITSCKDACLVMLALSPQSNPSIKERMVHKNKLY